MNNMSYEEENRMRKESGNQKSVRRAYKDPTADLAIAHVMREVRRKRQKPRERRTRPGGEADAAK